MEPTSEKTCMTTEMRNPGTMDLDAMTPLEIVTVMNLEDGFIPGAVRKHLKEIARAALDAQHPLIVILENGFPPLYKPPGKYFDACAKGLLLMLAPWPYHTERRTITREQCLALNSIACEICDEPWTSDKEQQLLQLALRKDK